MLIANVGDLSDLSSTIISVHAGAELANGQRDSECFGILISLLDPLLVPSFAHLGSVCLRLTRGIACADDLAAVRMIIEDMVLRTNLATWWLAEAEVEDPVEGARDAKFVWELSRLEPHVSVVFIFLVYVVNTRVHWL